MCETLYGYQRFYSVTAMLFELSLPTFDTVLINSKQAFIRCCNCDKNSLVALHVCVNEFIAVSFLPLYVFVSKLVAYFCVDKPTEDCSSPGRTRFG